MRIAFGKGLLLLAPAAEGGLVGVMSPLVALLVITLISLLAVRIGSTALMMTGLSWDTASFQSYSAFFGVGFTTREAEMVVNHPVRRRIIRDLILAGNIGLTSALATLVVTAVQSDHGIHPLFIIAQVVLALVIVLYLSGRPFFRRLLDWVIQRMLERSGLVRALDYELLLRIQSGYCVSEVEITADSTLVNRTLRESRPWDHGVIILAIKREGTTIPGIPGPTELLKVGDVATVYGEEGRIKGMF
jgi:hypothetical protein